MTRSESEEAEVIILDELPSAVDFSAKRASCGWGTIPVGHAENALRMSLYGAVAIAGGKCIGFVRVVGDGVLNLYIQDLIVDDDWRGHGVGGLLMRQIMTRIEREATGNVAIGLMSAAGKEGFYEAFGFAARPDDGYGAGMTKFI